MANKELGNTDVCINYVWKRLETSKKKVVGDITRPYGSRPRPCSLDGPSPRLTSRRAVDGRSTVISSLEEPSQEQVMDV